MKIRISEASGRVLDLLVAMAGGGKDAQAWYVNPYALECFSTDPIVGGPVLDEERIGTVASSWWTDAVRHEGWIAGKTIDDLRDQPYQGATRLEAGLRCFAASELGAEIEVPDDLIARVVAPRAVETTPARSGGVESFTSSEVGAALEAYLKFGEGSVGTAHHGYVSGAGWAARCLRYHRDQLTVQGASAKQPIAETLPRDIANLLTTSWPYQALSKNSFARIWWSYVGTAETALNALSGQERASLADRIDPRWYANARDAEMGEAQLIKGIAQKVVSAYFKSPASEGRVPRPFSEWLEEETARCSDTQSARETQRG